jgi:hypothetical protein
MLGTLPQFFNVTPVQQTPKQLANRRRINNHIGDHFRSSFVGGLEATLAGPNRQFRPAETGIPASVWC